MRLVYEHNGEEVRVGDIVTLRFGEEVKVTYFRPPHSPASSGKVTVQYSTGAHSEYYVGVIGAKWIEREDHHEIA